MDSGNNKPYLPKLNTLPKLNRWTLEIINHNCTLPKLNRWTLEIINHNCTLPKLNRWTQEIINHNPHYLS